MRDSKTTVTDQARLRLFRQFVLCGAFLALATLGCAGKSTERTDGPMPITVSILPQAWFAEKIGGDLVTVSVLVGPGYSPATYEPTPRQMANLQRAALFFCAGVPFERGFVGRIEALEPGPRLVGPRLQPASHHTDTHGHSHHDTDDHAGLDPHTWLDPQQAMALADSVGAALAELLPEHGAELTLRTAALQTDLADLDREVREILADSRGRMFFVFHPAFGHFAAAYGLKQVAIEAGGHEPGTQQLAGVIDQARRAGVGTVVTQPQFSGKSAAAVARSIDADLVRLDPLSADYAANLRHIARTLARISVPQTEENP